MTYLPLIATLIALLCGPLLYAVARERSGVLAFLDGFVLVSIAGLVLLEVLPGTFGEGGMWSLVFVAVGAIGPSLLEGVLYRARREAHLATLALAVLGLLLHSLGDGAALSPHGDSAHEALAIAVAVHSIPVGLAVWWIMAPVFGALWPALTIAAMCIGTAAGFVFGIELNQVLGARAFAWFQALVAGSILHVVFGRPHLHDGEHESHAAPPFEGLGNLVALLALALLQSLDPHHGLFVGFVERMQDLALRCAPALMLAFLLGGFIGNPLSSQGLQWLSRRGTVGQAIRGALSGLLLPGRSAGGSFRYRALKKRGAPAASAIAFFVATSCVGLTAALVSVPLLGVEFSFIRLASAAALAVISALLIARFADSGKGVALPEPQRMSPAKPSGLARALRAGLIDLVDAKAAWIVAGLALAALVSPYLDALSLAAWPRGLDVLVFALLGLPIYLCATGVTPLVAALLVAGLSPGAGLAVLLIGPVANLSTLGALRHTHGSRFAAVFGAIVCLGAIALGTLLNHFLPTWNLTGLNREHQASMLEVACALMLTGLFIASLLRSGGRRWISELIVVPRAVESSI